LQRFAATSTSTQVTMLPWRYDAEMGTAKLLLASEYYGEYNERYGSLVRFYPHGQGWRMGQFFFFNFV